jgi:diaminopimelate decarboxylase
VSDVRQLFPSGTPVDASGALVLGGCSVLDLAAEFGTPTLLVDETALRARAQRYVSGLAERWPDTRVARASKSFPCTAVYRCLVRKAAVSTSPVAVS